MKKVLILGAIDSFCDLIRDFKQKNIKTVVCDYYEGAPGKKIADYPYDISTLDLDGLEAIGRKHNIDGIMCAFSDRNIYPCYEIARRLNLPQMYNPHLIDLLTDKIMMKKHLVNDGFPIINYKILPVDFTDSDLDGIEFPVVTKPVDSSGSKGIYICDNPDDIRRKMHDTLEMSVNYKNEFLIEEYYPYDEISITAWVKDGDAYVTCVYDNEKIFDKNSEMNVTLSNVVFPSKYTDAHIDEFRLLTDRLAKSFGIQTGPMTVQCFIGPRGLKVNEVILRLAGDSAYMCSEVLGAPSVARMTEDFTVGNDIEYNDLETFTPAGKKTHHQIGVYVHQKGKIHFDFTKESLMKGIPGLVRADVFASDSDEYKFITTGGNVVARLYIETDAISNSYEEFASLLRRETAVRSDDGKIISSLHTPEGNISRECYEFSYK